MLGYKCDVFIWINDYVTDEFQDLSSCFGIITINHYAKYHEQTKTSLTVSLIRQFNCKYVNQQTYAHYLDDFMQ